MWFPINLFFTLLALVSTGRVAYRIFSPPHPSASRVYFGTYYTKMAGMKCALGPFYCFALWSSNIGLLAIPLLILSGVFLIFLNRMLRPFIHMENDVIHISTRPERGDQILTKDQLISINLHPLDDGEHQISFVIRDSEPIRYRTEYREPQFLAHIQFFAEANAISLHWEEKGS